jgi:lysine-specific demethylase 3
VWDIWRREDVDKLRTFLTTFQHLFPSKTTASGHVEVPIGTDPVRMQRFMLQDHHRELLLLTTGIQAWHFEQHVGEAVFIPAGCAHQVLGSMLHSLVILLQLLISQISSFKCVEGTT